MKMLSRQKLKCFFFKEIRGNENHSNFYGKMEFARFDISRFTHKNFKMVQKKKLKQNLIIDNFVKNSINF